MNILKKHKTVYSSESSFFAADFPQKTLIHVNEFFSKKYYKL